MFLYSSCQLIGVWAVVRQIAQGAYGNVYHVINIKDNTQGTMKVKYSQECIPFLMENFDCDS